MAVGSDSIEDSYPLTSVQEGMLFEWAARKEPGADIEQLVWRLNEDLDISAFVASWEHLIRCHAVLRTAIQWRDLPRPMQHVYRAIDCPVTRRNLAHTSEERREPLLQSFLWEDRLRGFDLGSPPLQRLTLLEFGPSDFIFIWTYHHILLDARGAGILVKEFFSAYEGIKKGEDIPRTDEVPFRHFVDWLGRLDHGPSRIHWREIFSGFEPSPLTSLRLSGHGESFQGVSHGLAEGSLPANATSRLLELGSREDLTLNTFCQGAWALLLSRYTSSQDIVFGAVQSCRKGTVPGGESIVGLLVNTLPVRVRVASGEQLLPWLRAMRALHKSGRSFQYTPLVDVQEIADLLPGTPLFESIVAYDNRELNEHVRGPEAVWKNRAFSFISQTGYPITLILYGGTRLVVRLRYRADFISAETAEGMVRHFITLLEGFSSDPESTLESIPMLTAHEQQVILKEWNQTKTEYPRTRYIHEIFEEEVKRYPEAEALLSGDEHITYHELNLHANRIAQRLTATGVRFGDRVGICFERSPELIAGVLAVLKAGGVCIPLDPASPDERLLSMIADAGTIAIVTSKVMMDRLFGSHVRMVCLDERGKTGDSQPVGVCPELPRGDALAYIVYTSGSTGKPKGVAMPHRCLVNLVSWQTSRSWFKPARTLHYAALGFDVSFQEIFSTLCSGGTLVLLPEFLRRDLPALIRLLDDRRVERIFMPFTSLNLLAEARNELGVAPQHLKHVVCAGEQLHVSTQIRKLFEMLPGCMLENQYGPSETHVVTSYCLSGSPEQWPEFPPIGKPISNTQAYILDAMMNPVPVGALGELFFGGDCLAQGYVHDEQGTAERFLTDPFGCEAGARLYRTGDYGRYTSDGSIEFAGRKDGQRKVRGYRVEPGEIESVLRDHPAVTQSAVVIIDREPGVSAVIAYCVPRKKDMVTEVQLKTFLKAKLPEYMVPSSIIFMESLPVTQSGKVDRRHLPLPSLNSSREEADEGTPRDAVERRVADIWADVLGKEKIGIHDDFFDLGGQSLLAMRVLLSLSRVFGVELPLWALFEHTSVEALAEVVRCALRSRPITQKTI